MKIARNFLISVLMYKVLEIKKDLNGGLKSGDGEIKNKETNGSIQIRQNLISNCILIQERLNLIDKY
jgi:hypothetical protein